METFAEVRSRVLRLLDRLVRVFPEAQPLDLIVAAGSPEDVRLMTIDPAIMALVAHPTLLGELRTDEALAREVVHHLGHLVWWREVGVAGARCRRGELLETADDIDEAEAFGWFLKTLDELGADVITVERAQAHRLAFAVVDRRMVRDLDGLASDVAGLADHYRNELLPRSRHESLLPPGLVRQIERSLPRAEHALRRYAAARVGIDEPLLTRGLSMIAERPGFEFLRTLAGRS